MKEGMVYKSDAFEAIHEDAVSMYKVGAISEERMKEYDEMCLVKESEPAYKTEKPAESPARVMEHATA